MFGLNPTQEKMCKTAIFCHLVVAFLSEYKIARVTVHLVLRQKNHLFDYITIYYSQHAVLNRQMFSTR